MYCMKNLRLKSIALRIIILTMLRQMQVEKETVNLHLERLSSSV